MAAETSQILVVDDDESIREVVQLVLERGGMRVRTAEDGRAALKVLFAGTVDAVLLDVDMPGLDGWQTLERIREVTDVPVCMLTSEDAELAKVRALRGGADDYVVKPFGPQELLARVEALVRRGRSAGAAAETVDVYEDDLLVVDREQRLVTLRGTELSLTRREYALLAALTSEAGRVLPSDVLIERVWDGMATADQVKLYVSRLRRKLAVHDADTAVETVRGIGYRYRPASS
ncbi:response regulator transcription factor [Patulibacter americanus]|jgi:DNA-binding response OmpR family regulator|uniref:response regulator transcription factor n=1 Tax=Patulibacter americanus TaxID=588672 RepID=UPI0003B3B184|nr:response regulator transcription factor [Patulibacter americanus]